jgi:predicted nucleotidyltransferase
MTDALKTPPTLAQLRARRAEILQVAAEHGAFNVRVFGSVARGEATPESDVDLLVQMRDGASMFDLVGLWLDLQDLLGCEVSLVTDDMQPRRQRFMQRIMEDAIAL